MSDAAKAAQVMQALTAAKGAPPPAALSMLNELAGLVQGGDDNELEVADARSSTFMAICEVAKALHRGQPADGLWTAAIGATERWIALVR